MLLSGHLGNSRHPQTSKDKCGSVRHHFSVPPVQVVRLVPSSRKAVLPQPLLLPVLTAVMSGHWPSTHVPGTELGTCTHSLHTQPRKARDRLHLQTGVQRRGIISQVVQDV